MSCCDICYNIAFECTCGGNKKQVLPSKKAIQLAEKLKQQKVKRDDKKEWIVDCTSCGRKSLTTWKEACEDGCPVCCSTKISIYHEKNLEEKE